MRITAILLLTVWVAAPVALGVVVAALAARSRSAVGVGDVLTDPGTYVRARRHAAVVATLAWTTLVAVTLALPVLVVPLRSSWLGAAPAAAGVLALLVAAVGEQTWPRPRGAVRRAALVRRTALDVAPRGPVLVTLTWSAALLGLLVVTSLTADDDGRSITLHPDATSSHTSGPYPGLPYAVPTLAAALVLILTAALTLHLVAGRPAVPGVSADDDTRLRRASAQRLLAAVQLVLAGTLGAMLTATGDALRRASTSRWAVDGVWTTARDAVGSALGWTALTLSLLVGVCGIVLAVVFLVRASVTLRPVPSPVVGAAPGPVATAAPGPAGTAAADPGLPVGPDA